MDENELRNLCSQPDRRRGLICMRGKEDIANEQHPFGLCQYTDRSLNLCWWRQRRRPYGLQVPNLHELTPEQFDAMMADCERSDTSLHCSGVTLFNLN